MNIGIGDIYEQHEKGCPAMKMASGNPNKYLLTDSGKCGCKKKWYFCESIDKDGKINWELVTHGMD